MTRVSWLWPTRCLTYSNSQPKFIRTHFGSREFWNPILFGLKFWEPKFSLTQIPENKFLWLAIALELKFCRTKFWQNYSLKPTILTPIFSNTNISFKTTKFWNRDFVGPTIYLDPQNLFPPPQSCLDKNFLILTWSLQISSSQTRTYSA